MEACPGLHPADPDSFDAGMEFLKTRVQYVFEKRRANPMTWELSTWSKHVRRSSIAKYGTESDKAALPETTRFSKARSTGQLKRKRKPSDNRRRCQQPPKRSNTNGNNDSSSSSEEVANENVSRRSRPPAGAARASVDADDITDVLDNMVNGLGLSNEVNRGIDNMHRNQEAARRQATFAHVDEDGNAVMMAQNANRGFGASSRDANYRDNVSRLVGGGHEKGYCAVANCRHVEMELRHKCDTCKRFVHIICLMENDLLISIVGGSGNYHYCSRLCVR
jgi:hypothetical protein